MAEEPSELGVMAAYLQAGRFPVDEWAAKIGLDEVGSDWPNLPAVHRLCRQLEEEAGRPLSVDELLVELPRVFTKPQAQRLAVNSLVSWLSRALEDYEVQRPR